MARGWESKSVESQIEDSLVTDATSKRLSTDELQRKRERESLELSRLRITTELRTAKAPLHRTALEHALAHLDEQIARLSQG
jgi:hypothetical protein